MNRISTEAAMEAESSQHTAIQKEVDFLAAERAEKKKIAEETLQQFAEERKSRKYINDKISEIKNFMTYLDEQFLKAYEVLSVPAEDCNKLMSRKNYAATTSLRNPVPGGGFTASRRFSERPDDILTLITLSLDGIEQNLGSFEWEDYEMTYISFEIKTQIFSFREIIVHLTLILELNKVDIDPAKTEEFAEVKDILFQQINTMVVISENRSLINEAIQQRQEEAMCMRSEFP
ncbi:unnamed protein product [Caenorhabditis brenneri]